MYWNRYVTRQPRNVPQKPTPKQQNTVSTGTGFFINSAGHLVTNNHVVESCSNIRVKGFGVANKVASDINNDIAVLKVNSGPKTFARLRDNSAVALGETVIVYVFPYAGTLSQDGNLTQGNILALSGLGNDIRIYQISAPVQPGNSGGPILDSSKNVLGIVTSKLNAIAIAKATGDLTQNVNFAIKNSILKSVLEINGIAYTKADFQRDYNLVEVAKAARKFTALVICD